MRTKTLLCIIWCVAVTATSNSLAFQTNRHRQDRIAIGYVVVSGSDADVKRGEEAIKVIRKALTKEHIVCYFDGSRTYDITVHSKDRDRAKKIVLALIRKQKLPAKRYKD